MEGKRNTFTRFYFCLVGLLILYFVFDTHTITPPVIDSPELARKFVRRCGASHCTEVFVLLER